MGIVLYFKVRRTTTVCKLKENYNEEVSVLVRNICLKRGLCDLLNNDTPDTLGMADRSAIQKVYQCKA
jgi:hypothetical protein